ncbi:helix-turn-helix domain-containing protein [uncultured Limosilactobacillus sp.]|uniref:helix-turn-helix domain-containing protein n=1 Tax=uncultured Limosilactobacillus sp. TaxID=2837629 RepID=UPI0025E845D1|nr:helix-turn-helix domain-containing protein [uncultured Limosilactobacillus sp.]
MVNTRIKDLRVTKGMSQEELATAAKVSVRTVQRLEAGQDGSIETLNLIAGALGVGVRDLFADETSDNQQERIKHSETQLQAQLANRHQEFHTFKSLYYTIFIIVMLVWGAFFPMIKGAWSAVIGMLWVGGWMVMEPLRRWWVIKWINPNLDAKYPLTASRPDKNRPQK